MTAWKERSNRCTHNSTRPCKAGPQLSSWHQTSVAKDCWALAVTVTLYQRSHCKPATKSDERSYRRFLATPHTMLFSGAITFNPKHIFFLSRDRPNCKIVHSPSLKLSIHWSRFQGQANTIARMQLSHRSPVVPVLCVNT